MDHYRNISYSNPKLGFVPARTPPGLNVFSLHSYDTDDLGKLKKIRSVMVKNLALRY